MDSRARYSLPPNCGKHPWLMFSHGKHSQRQTFFNISENCYYTKNIPELCNKKVVSSCNGWLLLKDGDFKDYSLLNLISMNKITLPHVADFEYKAYILWMQPNDPNCHILLVADNFFLMWQWGDNEFTRKNFWFESGECESIIIHQRKLHVITCRGPNTYLMVVDLDECSTKVINNEGPRPSLPGEPTWRRYLIEFGDELLLVYKIYDLKFENSNIVSKFEIYRWNQLKNTWEKVTNIGGRTIFLSVREGKCCLISDAGIKENSIYFFCECRNLYVYDLSDESLKISVPCPNVSKYKFEVCWIW